MTQTRPDTEVIFDPRTYAQGVPHEVFDQLRQQSPVVWVEEKPVLNWPTGPGYWAVLRHADVKQVLRDYIHFSSHLGGTQIRDPRTPQDLAFVQQMMLNMDPPEHSRLRRLLAKAACLGAPLARMQMRAIFIEILDQLGELELVGPPARLVSNFQLGLKRLPVRWKKMVRPEVG